MVLEVQRYPSGYQQNNYPTHQGADGYFNNNFHGITAAQTTPYPTYPQVSTYPSSHVSQYQSTWSAGDEYQHGHGPSHPVKPSAAGGYGGNSHGYGKSQGYENSFSHGSPHGHGQGSPNGLGKSHGYENSFSHVSQQGHGSPNGHGLGSPHGLGKSHGYENSFSHVSQQGHGSPNGHGLGSPHGLGKSHGYENSFNHVSQQGHGSPQGHGLGSPHGFGKSHSYGDSHGFANSNGHGGGVMNHFEKLTHGHGYGAPGPNYGHAQSGMNPGCQKPSWTLKGLDDDE